MGELGVIIHQPFGQILHIGHVGVRTKRPFGLSLDRRDTETERLFHQMQIARSDFGHDALQDLLKPPCHKAGRYVFLDHRDETGRNTAAGRGDMQG